MSVQVGGTSNGFYGKLSLNGINASGSINKKVTKLGLGPVSYDVLTSDSFLIFEYSGPSAFAGKTISLPDTGFDDQDGMTLELSNRYGSQTKKVTISTGVDGSTGMKIYRNETYVLHYDKDATSGALYRWSVLNFFYKTKTVFSAVSPYTIDDETTFIGNPVGVNTVNLPLAEDFSPNIGLEIKNIGSGTLTVAASGSDTIDGASSISLTSKKNAFIKTYYDGATYRWAIL